MGNAQSQSGAIINSSKPFDFDSPDIDKNELLTVILMRLLEKTDIVDFLALVNGPGNCGSYIILLEENLKKEFQQIQLATTLSGSKQTKSFLFTKAKDISTETPADTVVCRELAIFYIRLLQLIGALTMSIFTPNNLIDRIRNDAYQRSLKKQRANIPLTAEQLGAQRSNQRNWLRTYLLSSVVGTSEVFTLKNKTSYKYYKKDSKLAYTDSDGFKFEVILEMEEPEKYPVIEDNKKPDSYWIILKHPKSKAVLSRRLVSKDGRAYIFMNNPDLSKGPEVAVDFENDWAEGIDNIISTSGEATGITQVAKKLNSNNTNGRFSKQTLEELARARIPLNVLTRRGGGLNKRKTRKGGAYLMPKPAEVPKLNFGTTTTLPKQFQESYSFLKRWSKATSSWAESAPATYRSTLLMVKPNIPGSAVTSYICIDNWAGKSMRQIAPFAALEALYRNNDDGSIGYSNQAGYKALVEKFASVYNNDKTRQVTSFADIVISKLPEKVINSICVKSSPQGDVIMEDKFNNALLTAQNDLLELYKKHFGFVIEIFKKIFVPGKNAKGEIAVSLNEIFMKNTEGARNELEQIILVARGNLAQHYIAVEERYSVAINDLKLAAM